MRQVKEIRTLINYIKNSVLISSKVSWAQNKDKKMSKENVKVFF